MTHIHEQFGDRKMNTFFKLMHYSESLTAARHGSRPAKPERASLDSLSVLTTLRHSKEAAPPCKPSSTVEPEVHPTTIDCAAEDFFPLAESYRLPGRDDPRTGYSSPTHQAPPAGLRKLSGSSFGHAIRKNSLLEEYTHESWAKSPDFRAKTPSKKASRKPLKVAPMD